MKDTAMAYTQLLFAAPVDCLRKGGLGEILLFVQLGHRSDST